MLRSFGASVTSKDTTVTIEPEPELTGQKVVVPGDISSAAYFIAAGLLVPGSEILIKNVGTNPTRDGILRVCRQMGADIRLLDPREHCQEPAADILVRFSSLKGTQIQGELIPALIDELPVIAVMAAFAEGTTVIRDAQELKVKESNRPGYYGPSSPGYGSRCNSYRRRHDHSGRNSSSRCQSGQSSGSSDRHVLCRGRSGC